MGLFETFIFYGYLYKYSQIYETPSNYFVSFGPFLRRSICLTGSDQISFFLQKNYVNFGLDSREIIIWKFDQQ